MAEVILFRPKEKNAKVFYRFPLGVIYLGTSLAKNGYEVKIIDMETTPDWSSELKKNVDSSTICAGVSVMTGYQIKGALDFAMALKELKDIPVVWGGLHPSLLPEQTMENGLVDIVLTGEGEKRFVRLVENIKHNNNPSDIKGILYREKGKVMFTGCEADFLNMDSLPCPNYSLVKFDYYSLQKRRFMDYKNKVVDLNTGRGCPFRCAFCYNLKFNQRKWRSLSAGRLLDIVGELKYKYGVDAINFVADNFFVDTNRVYEICQGLIERKFDIKWHSDIRIDAFLRFNDELVKLIKESGCTTLTFGVESGSDRVLEIIQKDITVDDVLKAHKKAVDFDFKMNYHFMIGFPGEDKKDIIETLKLIRVLKKDKNAVIYGPSTYVPYPGTPLYDRSVAMGFISPQRLEDWVDYDWSERSKLASFSEGFKNYIQEVWHIFNYSDEDSHGIVVKDSFWRRIYRKYFQLRIIGLILGGSLFDIEYNLSFFFRFYKNKIIKLGYAKNKQFKR